MTGLEAPANVILDLKASICSWGVGALVIGLYVGRRVEPLGEPNPHNIVKEWHLIAILGNLISL